MKETIAQFLKVKDFPFFIKDKNNNEIYIEYSDGFWIKREFDQNGKLIYYENSSGYWYKTEYDQDGKLIYYEDSNGTIIDKRPKTEPTRLSSSDLLAVLRNTPFADLTAMKTASIINRSGHKITGFVLCHPETQERCIVEMSACRWLTNEEMWRLMHVSESPLT
jgi:hypothetical protein